MVSYLICNCRIDYIKDYNLKDRVYLNDIIRSFFKFFKYIPNKKLGIYFLSEKHYKYMQDDNSYGFYDDPHKRICINNNQKTIDGYATTLIHELYHSYQYYKGNKALIDFETKSFIYEERSFEISAHYFEYIFYSYYLHSKNLVNDIILKYKLKIVQKEISDNYNYYLPRKDSHIRLIFLSSYYFSNKVLNLF